MVPAKSSAGAMAASGKRKKTEKEFLEPKSSTVKKPKKVKLSVRVVDSGFPLKNSKSEEAIVERRDNLSNTKKTENGSRGSGFIRRSLNKDFLLEDRKNKAKKEIEVYKEGKNNKDKKKKSDGENKPSPGLYRNIALSFLFLTTVLLFAVFYLYFVKLTIRIEPKKERIVSSVSFKVYDEQKNSLEAGEDYILGSVEELEVKKENVYKTSGEEILGHEIIGSVTLINNTFENKTLVATTRLLSPDGKLFRLKKEVTIPANGRIEADIYADEPSEELAMAPGSFTIPGLWAGLQEKVYAENKEPFVYKRQIKKFVEQIDIDMALKDLKTSLVNEVNEKLSQDYKGFDEVVLSSDESSFRASADVKSGQEAESFKISASMKVKLVAFSQAVVNILAKKKFETSLADDMKISSLDDEKMEFSLVDADFEKGEADIDLDFAGYAVPREAGDVLDRKKIIGLNEAQIKDYLSNLDKFSGFELVFWPSFIKKAPVLTDKIKIQVKE